MSHHATRSGYARLVDRLNRFPQGAPPAETLNQILRLLFSEREAELVSLLPIKPFTVGEAARAWKQPAAEARDTLERLASRGLLLDVEHDGSPVYVLPPPMAGFFEFSMMRVRRDIDQRMLAELFYQYLNVEEDFIKSLFTAGETQLGRVFVHEPVLTSDLAVEVLDHERSSEVIKRATHRAVSLCYCRHKMAPPRPRLRRAARDLHGVQQRRGIAHPARHCEEHRRRRGPRHPAGRRRAESRAVR